MKISKNVWCKFFNLHTYEIIEKTFVKDVKDNIIGTTYVSRCTNCGKINSKTVYTEERYGQR